MYPEPPHSRHGNLSQQLATARERVRSLETELVQARAELAALERTDQSLRELDQTSFSPYVRHQPPTRRVNAGSSLSEKLELFGQRFVGRDDVYATRWASRKTLKPGWSPAVNGDSHTANTTAAGFLPLTPPVLERHLRGTDEGTTQFHVGLYPMTAANQCKLLACDFDGHTWKTDSAAFAQACTEADISSLTEISRSGDGAHVWIFFESWLPASTARSAGMVLLRRAIQKNASMTLQSYDRFFPAQDELPAQAELPLQDSGRMRLGNLIALPLQGNCRRGGTTVFADPTNWKPYDDQFEALALTTPVPRQVIDKLATEQRKLVLGPTLSTSVPSRPERKALRSGLQGQTINIRRGSMLHIPTENLSAALISELKHRASIANPEYYRRQAQRFSTFGVPRLVTSFEHDQSELRLPRGLADETRQLLKKAGAKVTIRNIGKRPQRQEIAFTGQLRVEQHDAVRAIVQHQDGVLVAPPGSGKTVMGCALIAERHVPTAILVNRAELLHQWRERLTTFLDIEDKQIGQLGNGRKKRKGVVDLIMMQSISRRDSDPTILEDYGQIIVDECHAIAAPSTEAAIRTVNVKYWTGLTATPFRADRMNGLITMQCGPIRHVMEGQAPGDRELVVHKTTFTTDEPGTDGPSIQAIYSELSMDTARNQLIIDQVVAAASEQRYCMVLTNRIAHLQALHTLLKPLVSCEVFTLHGQLVAQERRQVRQNIAESAKQDKPFILLSIDKIAGEGLDIPAMDTLFLTMPVSFKGRIIQQAGRVTRDSTDGPAAAVVHDFRDLQVPMLERMHRRRLKILQKEGFTLEPKLPLMNT